MTTGDIDSFLGATEVPRDRYGRPLIKTPDGKSTAYTRCTTFVGVLEDTYNLAKWQQRMVALGLASRDDLLMAVSAHHDDKQELDRICEAAKEAAAASSGATIGTALHRICERLDRGEKIDVPTAAKADVAAYQRATKGIRWTHIERITVHDGLKVAGTPDRIGIDTDGVARVFDLKTGSVEYGMGKISMQLAMYAHSQAYDPDLNTRSPLEVDLDKAVVIHLPAGSGTCELLDVDIAAGWEAIDHAEWVRGWRKRKGLSVPRGKGLEAVPEVGDTVAVAIARANTVDALMTAWETATRLGVWDDAKHVPLASARKAELLAS